MSSISLAAAIVALTPSSYWKLANSGTDEMGVTNGTITNAVAANSIVPTDGGTPNGALTFDGTGDYVTMGDFYDFAGTASWSAHFVMKPSSLASASVQPISKSPAWRINLLTAGDLQIVRNEAENATFASGVVVGTTYQVVMTYDGADGRCYVGGALVGSPLGLSATVVGNANGFRIGAAADNGFSEYPGQLQHVAIWNTVLSQANVTTLFNAYGATSEAVIVQRRLGRYGR